MGHQIHRGSVFILEFGVPLFASLNVDLGVGDVDFGIADNWGVNNL